MVEEEDYEVDLPDVQPRAPKAPDVPAGPPPDEMSPMQKAVLDSGAKPVEGNPWAFQTNEGTVFIASPADMARSSMMDATFNARWSRAYKPTNAEVDRLMKEDRD